MGIVQMKVEISSGLYTLKKPVGRLGAKQFAIITNAAPSGVPEAKKGTKKDKNFVMSDRDKEKMTQAFEEWSELILPGIFVDGPNKPEEMSGEDQFALFTAVMDQLTLGDDNLFRIVQ